MGSNEKNKGRNKGASISKEQRRELERNPNIDRVTEKNIYILPDFRAMLYKAWLEDPSSSTIHRLLEESGITDNSILAKMTRNLANRFAEESKERGENPRKGSGRGRPRKGIYAENTVKQFSQHPYIASIDIFGFQLKDEFYRDASILLDSYSEDKILEIFGLDGLDMTRTQRQSILYKVRQTNSTSEETGECIENYSILGRRMIALESMVENGFKCIGQMIPTLDKAGKKMVCEWVHSFPRDKKYSLKYILKSLGITPSYYYSVLRNEDYGKPSKKKQEDVALVRMVVEYKGFMKGSRQVKMLMKTLTGRKMGLRKIRRIMKENGMECKIRKSNVNRRAAKKILEEHVKPNLLRRRFRLFRPNMVRLTDVTYLKIKDAQGNDLTLYGSAIIDPVTGRAIVFNISDHNNEELVQESLRLSEDHPCIAGGIFHSDQGTLYLSDEFQKKVEEMGLQQSMSKRGNSQDNAPMESFFGHFKDECIYEDCTDLEGVKELVKNYFFYYNNERGMWDREQMTPVQFEAYLSNMSEAEFSEYLAHEEEEYQRMKEHAAELARKRKGTLGVEEDTDD